MVAGSGVEEDDDVEDCTGEDAAGVGNIGTGDGELDPDDVADTDNCCFIIDGSCVVCE